jgi:hypothetical protein
MNERNWFDIFVEEWQRRGRKAMLLNQSMRLLRRKFGELPTPVQEHISQVETRQLEILLEDLLDFNELNDLEAWLRQNPLVNGNKKS